MHPLDLIRLEALLNVTFVRYEVGIRIARQFTKGASPVIMFRMIRTKLLNPNILIMHIPAT